MTAHAAPAPAAAAPASLPAGTRARIVARSFLVQAAWSYEAMVGPGLAWVMEPALRALPGGRDGAAYRAAVARHAQYFNCHPYLATVAVGALARLEHDREPAAAIERFRGALPGPLGSVGDRLVWAAWLPACALLGLLAWGLGAGAGVAVAAFLVPYNAGHLWMRAWGLEAGWRNGRQVAAAIAGPVLRDGPAHLARVAAALAGLALPLVTARVVGGDRVLGGLVLAASLPAGYVIARLHGRVQGWAVAFGLLVAVLLLSLVA